MFLKTTIILGISIQITSVIYFVPFNYGPFLSILHVNPYISLSPPIMLMLYTSTMSHDIYSVPKNDNVLVLINVNPTSATSCKSPQL